MNKFEARSTLGSEAVPVFDDDGELTGWRENRSGWHGHSENQH